MKSVSIFYKSGLNVAVVEENPYIHTMNNCCGAVQ